MEAYWEGIQESTYSQPIASERDMVASPMLRSILSKMDSSLILNKNEWATKSLWTRRYERYLHSAAAGIESRIATKIICKLGCPSVDEGFQI